LQSKIEGDDGDILGFYGRCMHHEKYDNKYPEMVQSGNTFPANPELETDKGTCARTEVSIVLNFLILDIGNDCLFVRNFNK